jgi:predicted MFS family arabinose efflux permease
VIGDSAGDVRAASRATYIAFIGSGFVLASWAARIPQVRDGLGLSPSRLGLVLLAIAAGSIVSLVLSGQIVTRLGSRRVVVAMAALMGVAIVAVAVGYRIGVFPVVVGLIFFGFANGAWDVAMNVQGTVVERRLGRAIMPRFHAGFSVGTVGGALIGAAAVALHVPVTAHLIVAALVVAAIVIISVRGFVSDSSADPSPDVAAVVSTETGAPGEPGPVSRMAGTLPAGEPAAEPHTAEPHTAEPHTAEPHTAEPHTAEPAALLAQPAAAEPTGFRRTLATWAEPRTLLIGVFVLAFAFTEGTGIDWISVAVIDGYGAPATVGTLAFATFLAAMTLGRWLGPGLLDKYGRVPVVRALAAISLVGLVLFVFGPSTPVAFVGALFWGLGASLGFPVGMSAAADDPAKAAARVSVVASIGYCAFLGGPPLIGFLGDHFTVRKGLIAVVVLLGVAISLAGAIRPLGSGRVGSGD